ncbi:hypothetical protein [Jatrophihabitans sp.]|uniref:hypothetical protein n=1 Tax=Jatrophihabitans sp. TaxID=1932789 RepID=UPI002C9B5B1C|nr:hypothetical protein [Jatrophihabitans sp.]
MPPTPVATSRGHRLRGRRWATLLPVGSCASVLALFVLDMLPPGSAEFTISSRADTMPAAGQPSAGTPAATPSPTWTTPTAAPSPTSTPTTTPARTAAPKAEVVPSAREPIGGRGIQAAADYATARGYRVGVAVLDTRTGTLWGADEHASLFASESVVKVFIATRLLLDRQLTGDLAETAYRMIARSDDGAADALYGYAGGDDVLPWLAAHYDIPDLGSPPSLAGWWSNTHISATGLVRFYAKVKADPVVWPWLSKAMHAATEYGSDGTYQFFGLKQADPGAAIKQGWGQDDDDWSASSDFNSTGFVDSDRYAVAILVKGPSWQYNSGTPAMVTSVARMLMPGGVMRP